MISALFSVLMPLVILIITIFLTLRLGYFSREKISGGYAFLFGGLMLTAVAGWQAVKNNSEYRDWFVDGAYPVLDIAQLALLIAGMFLVMVGLAFYADYWQIRRGEIDNRDQRLSILGNLQSDAREPYQTIELLDISIKEITSHLPETAGAIFLLNRARRQLVLTSAVGFTKSEVASLERYPYGRNIVSQGIELTEPIISSTFDFYAGDGQTIVSRFNSCLVLPMISVSEKIGAIVLVSEESRHFSRSEIKYLSPAASWLAELIRSSRLSKELATAKRDLQSQSTHQADFSHRLLSAVMAFSTSEVVTSFCRVLVSLVGSQSVQLVGMKSGALHVYGGSEPIAELSENYRTALIDGLDRKKPLIINQEASSEDGRSYIARSTLLYPLAGNDDPTALVFAKEGTPFRVDESQLRTLDVFARLARLALSQSDLYRLDITRRKGLDKVVQLLRFDQGVSFEGDPGQFVDHIGSLLPAHAIALTCARQANGSFRVAAGLRAGPDLYRDIETLPGEGIVGDVATERTGQFVFGRNKVDQAIRVFDESNRDSILRLFGERGLPNFLSACAVTAGDDIKAVVLMFMYDITENEKAEWSRLLTLAAGLYSVRLTVAGLTEEKVVYTSQAGEGQALGEVVNRLNNHLSAIVGNAGLADLRQDLSGEVRNHFKSIVGEAEQAAAYLKQVLVPRAGELSDVETSAGPSETINDVVESVLSRSRISDNLYMVGGGPREISKTFGDLGQTDFASDAVRNLFEEAMNRFASRADEEDVITVSTYRLDDHVYLDISRHHRDFPPVQKVAGFGRYQTSDSVLKYRPTDTFLKYVEEQDCHYSFDRVAENPSYLSFKFPVKRQAQPAVAEQRRPRILAIDDQPVILDLISAMCQTGGYEVKTAESGDEGLQLALDEKFDIILTDLAMPGLSGIEIAHEIRKKRADIPIVLVTGWEVNISREKMEAAGITRVLYKPFRIEQLTDLIETLIQSRIAT